MDNPDLNINLMRGFLIKLILRSTEWWVSGHQTPLHSICSWREHTDLQVAWITHHSSSNSCTAPTCPWVDLSGWLRCVMSWSPFWKMEATNPVYLWSATAPRWPHPTPAELLNCLTSFCPAWIPSSRSSRSGSSFYQLGGLERYLTVFSWDLPPPTEYLQATCFPGSLHKKPKINEQPEI